MKRIIALLFCGFVIACSEAKTEAPTTAVVDAETEATCKVAGNLAASFAAARDRGVELKSVLDSIEKVGSATNSTEVILYWSAVAAHIYGNPKMTKEQAYNELYKDCLRLSE